MSWIAPAAWIVGAAALAALAVAHLLSRRRPDARPFPTARFVPERAPRVTSRGIALSDVLLLVVRAAALVVLAAAFAGPLTTSGRGRIARVVVVDRSRAVADAREARDSAAAPLVLGASLVTFDSAARLVPSGTMDGSAALSARGSLSAALVAAMREGARLAGASDSVELTVVSPLADEELDAATLALRAGWPGRVRLVRIAPAVADSAPRPMELDPGVDDAAVAGLRLAGAVSSGVTVRVRRSSPSAADSAWARERGHVLVHWPEPGADAATAGSDAPLPGTGWRARSHVDTIGAVVVGDRAVIAPFVRRWSVDGDAVARFADGAPAIADHAAGEGCIRDVALSLPPGSDLALRSEFRVIAAAIARPCEGAGFSGALADSGVVARLAGSGALAPAAALRSRRDVRSPWTPALLALALLLLAGEWWMRRERITA